MIYTDTHNSFGNLIHSLGLEITPMLTSSPSCLLTINDYVLLSSYYYDQSLVYSFLKIQQLRTAGHKCTIGLLTFEKEQSIYKSLDTWKGLQIFRLPLSVEVIRDIIHSANQQIAEEDIEFAITQSQTVYLDKALQQLKHGNELELLSTSLIPLRVMVLNVLMGTTSSEKFQIYRSALVLKLKNKTQFQTFFNVLNAITNKEHPRYATKMFFNKLFVSLNKPMHSFNLNNYLNELDELMVEFDKVIK